MKRLLRQLRDTFISGLLAILPVGATAYIVWLMYRLIDGLVGQDTPFGATVERALGRWIPGLGIVITILLVLLIGVITRNFLGRTVHYYFERLLLSVPGVRKMYGTLRQFTTALLNREDRSSFQKVVMFEFPQPGTRALGLVTNEHLGKLQDLTGEECVLVYVPTAPNPLSGYMLIVPARKVTYVDMPVEDALSMVVSSGSALPDSLQVEPSALVRPRRRPFRRRQED
ncbi:MAG: DUF502 domain-containing protein [Candidatus Bipolaricaulota bacterium]|nr:MAG: DUF502 domain-containing protein [Candidatus Bipolaricaulota bacterium]